MPKSDQLDAPSCYSKCPRMPDGFPCYVGQPARSIRLNMSREMSQQSCCGRSQYSTRCTRGVRVVFSVTRMRSSNSASINKFDFRTEKSCSVHMTVFEIVAGHNVVNWMQLLT